MKLSSEDGTIIDAPTGQDVAKVVAALAAPGNAFAVLEADDGFVQLLAIGGGRYELERNQGSDSSTLKASRGEPLSRDAAIDVLSMFAAGRSDWSNGIAWTTDTSYGYSLMPLTKIILAVTGLLTLMILAFGLVV